MYSNDGDKIRAFPFRPVAESSGLTDYIELSGCNGLLVEAVKKLYEVPNKPDNPIEWLRLYFKYKAEDVAAGAFIGLGEGAGDADSDFTRDPEEVELLLKRELASIESEIISCFEEESQNKAIIEKLDHELKRVTLNTTKNHGFDDFLKYLEQGEDYHYRIRPDPLYQPSKTDMLLEKEEMDKRSGLRVHGYGGGGGFGGGAPLRQEDSMVELVPFNPQLWSGDGHGHGHLHAGLTGHTNVKKEEENNVYKDYPKLYFPDRQPEEIEEQGVENEKEEEVDEETEEEEELDETFSGSEGGEVEKDRSDKKSVRSGKRSKGGTMGMGSDYDGGSEGGESEQSKAPKTKQSQYTPRSAHDRKQKEKKTLSQKLTSDKNV